MLGFVSMEWDVVRQQLVGLACAPDGKPLGVLVDLQALGGIPPSLLTLLRTKRLAGVGIAGNFREGTTFRAPVCTLEKVITQLGLDPHTPLEAIRRAASLLPTPSASKHVCP